MNAFPDDWTSKIERESGSKLITSILKRGLFISYHDGEGWAVKRSRDRKVISAEFSSTEEAQIVIRNDQKEQVGWFFLVYGNDEPIINDHTDNELCNAIASEQPEW